MTPEEVQVELERHPPVAGEIIALHVPHHLTEAQRNAVYSQLQTLSEKVGANGYVVVLEDGARLERIGAPS